MKNKRFQEILNWAKRQRNKNEYIFSLYDDYDGIYRLNICQQKDKEGFCSNYCNCDCAHWEMSIEVEKMNKVQYDLFEKVVEEK